MKDFKKKLIECAKKSDFQSWNEFRQDAELPIDLAGVNVSTFGDRSSLDLKEFDLSNCDLTGAYFNGLELKKLHRSILVDAKFAGAFLTGADMQFTELKGTLLKGAYLQQADLSYSVFDNTNVKNATFYDTNLYHAYGIEDAEMIVNMGLLSPDGGLRSEGGRPGFVFIPPREVPTSFKKRYRFDDTRIDHAYTWDKIRKFGQFPLFGVSTSAIVIIPALLLGFAYYNHGISILSEYVAQLFIAENSQKLSPETLSQLKIYVSDLKVQAPWELWLLLASTFFLFIASFLYTKNCPELIRQFTYQAWVFELGKDPVLYVPASYSYPCTRFICGAFFQVGAVLGGSYLLWKFGQAVWLYFTL